jgi:hypothetical protein
MWYMYVYFQLRQKNPKVPVWPSSSVPKFCFFSVLVFLTDYMSLSAPISSYLLMWVTMPYYLLVFSVKFDHVLIDHNSNHIKALALEVTFNWLNGKLTFFKVEC